MHDVFGIPMGYMRIPNCGNKDELDTKKYWKESFGDVNGGHVIIFKKGDDDFKRCFVMYAMITLLTPTLNIQVYWRFL